MWSIKKCNNLLVYRQQHTPLLIWMQIGFSLSEYMYKYQGKRTMAIHYNRFRRELMGVIIFPSLYYYYLEPIKFVKFCLVLFNYRILGKCFSLSLEIQRQSIYGGLKKDSPYFYNFFAANFYFFSLAVLVITDKNWLVLRGVYSDYVLDDLVGSPLVDY